MKLLCITDLHGKLSALSRIVESETDADVLILGGDLTEFGTPEDAACVLDACTSPGIPILTVAGNCDSQEIDLYLKKRGGSLHARGTVVDGVGFFGVSAMPPWMGNMYEFSEEEIASFLAAGFEQTRGAHPLVLVSHSPPRGSVDRTRSGAHVGSTAVRDWIERSRPDLLICGHIHEARGVDRVEDTVVVNCGLAKSGHYAVAVLGKEVSVELRQV